jgi:hypothetical protein
MFGNPEFFEIEQLKAMGMWPNSTMISRGIIPYVNRLRNDKIKITIVGDIKGESTYDILENCPKVFHVHTVNDFNIEDGELYKNLFTANIKSHKEKVKFRDDRESDVVCIDQRVCSVENLVKYYELTKSGGIFCGNGHEITNVKEQLGLFRRQVKIGTPIMISNRSVWLWIKR